MFPRSETYIPLVDAQAYGGVKNESTLSIKKVQVKWESDPISLTYFFESS